MSSRNYRKRNPAPPSSGAYAYRHKPPKPVDYLSSHNPHTNSSYYKPRSKWNPRPGYHTYVQHPSPVAFPSGQVYAAPSQPPKRQNPGRNSKPKPDRKKQFDTAVKVMGDVYAVGQAVAKYGPVVLDFIEDSLIGLIAIY